MGGALDYKHHIGHTPIGDVAAFANAKAGFSRFPSGWQSEWQAVGGLEVRF